MAIDVKVILQDLNCIRQDRGSDGSYPYIWPTTVSITRMGKVSVTGSEFPSLARVILGNAMKSGDTAAIPTQVGLTGMRAEDDLSDYTVLAVVALLEKRDLSDDEVLGGYLVFADSLQTAIEENRAGLASPDPDINQKAIDAINAYVHQKVMEAIESRMTDIEKVRYKVGLFTPDTVIDTAHIVVPTNGNSTFQLTFGNNQANFYTIDVAVELQAVTCEAEQLAVNQDQVVVNQLEAQLAEMKKELAQAPPAEKPGILQDIKEFSKTELLPAVSQLNRAKAALAACRAGQAVREPGPKELVA
jgi:hypothetical protein